jgi:hypothetical protein
MINTRPRNSEISFVIREHSHSNIVAIASFDTNEHLVKLIKMQDEDKAFYTYQILGIKKSCYDRSRILFKRVFSLEEPNDSLALLRLEIVCEKLLENGNFVEICYTCKGEFYSETMKNNACFRCRR